MLILQPNFLIKRFLIKKKTCKDQTEGLEEEDNIFKVLLDVHDDVPLEDPGPGIARVDREEGAAGAFQLDVGGDVPLEDPGPKTVNEHGGEGAAGETQ